MSAPSFAAGGTPIAGCVICFQEADRIEDCLRSLDFCDELVVVDSGSTDGTRELAAALGAEVHVNAPFPGCPEQRQVSVDRAHHDWVLCLDADERISPELRERLVALKAVGLSGAAYDLPRRNHYLGRVVRRGLFWPDRKVRLFDRRVARCGGTKPHDRILVPDGAEVTRLEAPIEHLSYRDFRQHARTVDSFSRTWAETVHAAGRRAHWWDVLVRPPAVFLKSLVVKLGFVDGWRGVVIAVMAFWFDWLKYWRLWRLGARDARGAA